MITINDKLLSFIQSEIVIHISKPILNNECFINNFLITYLI